MFSEYFPGALTVRVTFAVASVLAVLASLSPSRSSTLASATGRFFSSITERWIASVRESAAPELPGTQRIAIHRTNALAAALRNTADGDRSPILGSFIRTRMARKKYVKFMIVFRWADKHLSSA